jgi:hypothetical protein
MDQKEPWLSRDGNRIEPNAARSASDRFDEVLVGNIESTELPLLVWFLNPSPGASMTGVDHLMQMLMKNSGTLFGIIRHGIMKTAHTGLVPK